MEVVRTFTATLLLTLVACTATMPYRPETIVQQVSADTGIPADSILGHAPCYWGYARPGAPDVFMKECIFISSSSWAAIIGYDAESKHFQESVRIDDRHTGVAVKTRGELKQLQIRSGNGYIVMDFDYPGVGGIGETNALLAAIAVLKSLGLPEVAGRDFVRPYEQPVPVYIPIYLPSAGQ